MVIKMDKYITSQIIKKLREQKGMTQEELASLLFVSSKTISKWESGRGLPDISLIESLSKALNISMTELLNGYVIKNTNKSANINKTKIYVCPICGNVITSIGEAQINCCGITLPPVDSEDVDDSHQITIKKIDDEYYVTINHEMTKEHYISFILTIGVDNINIVKLYPESSPSAYFKIRGARMLYFYCNHHGLFKVALTKYKKMI